jgi:MoaF-like
MNWNLRRFFGMALLTGFLVAGPTSGESMMLKGKTYLFDYGDFQVRVQYLSDSNFRWKQIKGPAAGSSAEEKFHAVEIRPNVYFISWQEKDSSIINQVADFERQKVYTAWISPEKKMLHLEGKIEETK